MRSEADLTAVLLESGNSESVHKRGDLLPVLRVVLAVLSPAWRSSRWRSSRGVARTHRPVPAKLTTYECGIDPVGEGWSQSQVRYYIFGFLFVIFDVRVGVPVPWAGVFEDLGTRRSSRWASSSASSPSACCTPGARGC